MVVLIAAKLHYGVIRISILIRTKRIPTQSIGTSLYERHCGQMRSNLKIPLNPPLEKGGMGGLRWASGHPEQKRRPLAMTTFFSRSL